jgi:hypothetical protein
VNQQAEMFFAVVGIAVTSYGAMRLVVGLHLQRMAAVRRWRRSQERARTPVDWRPAPTLVWPPKREGRPVDGHRERR